MRRRKKILPILFLALLSSAVAGYIVFTIPPSSFSVFCFLFSVFCFLFPTLSLLLANTRGGFLFSAGITIFLLLRFLKIANFLTLTLLFSTLLSLEIYFRR